ncbi:hypothetical protein [Corynebacterium lizhenjunii]|nr:hypothetical protein [Corynebacterium lizhenjunii]
MQFTLTGLAVATIMLIAGASPFFFPAFIALGLAIDHNRKDTN